MPLIQAYCSFDHTIQLMEHKDIMVECMLSYEYIYNLCLCRMHLYYSEILLMESSYTVQITVVSILHKHNFSLVSR